MESKVIIDNPNYEFVESVHTTKETILYVLKLKSKIEDKFKMVSKRVEKKGGYWSSHQRGFVFKRILSENELNDLFKGVFFEEKVELEKIDLTKDAWNYTIEELKSFPFSKREDGAYVFKYLSDGKQSVYSVKANSDDDALKMFSNQVITLALINGKYNNAVSNGEISAIRAVNILKGIDSSLLEIEEDFGDLHHDIRAVWDLKQSNKEAVLDKLKYPFLFERNDMIHLSDLRYSQIIHDAINEGKYEKLIKDGVVPANKVAFIIESAGYEIPETIIEEAIYEKNKEVESLVGGFADGKTIFEIAKMHDVSVQEVIKQFKKGIKVEREHTKDKRKMGEIVKDHLFENPYYYDVLIKSERIMEQVDPSDFSNSEDYVAAVEQKEIEQDSLSSEEKAFLIARPIIDRIKQIQKKIEGGVPSEVESFLRNEMLNQFSELFNKVVVDFIFFTPQWLEMQNEFLNHEQKKEMLMFSVYNKGFYDDSSVVSFVNNVIDSEITVGNDNRKLNNIFDLIPYSFVSEVPSELDFEVRPKDKNLASILDSFVKKEKILSSLLGVYFSKMGAFASKSSIDIFIKAKRGYLKNLGIEEGIYGMSEISKDIMPTYGAKRLSMNKDKNALSFFEKYMSLYGNEKDISDKSNYLYTYDELISMFKDMSVVYNSKAYKKYLRVDVLGSAMDNTKHSTMKLSKVSYPMIYIKNKEKLFVVSFDDMLESLKAAIRIGIDAPQISVCEHGIYISEDVNSFLKFEESGIRISVKSVETKMPQGMLYFDIVKKKFFTNKIEHIITEEPKEVVKSEILVDDLKIRIDVVKKLISKKPEQKDDLEIRIRVIEKLINKKSQPKL